MKANVSFEIEGTLKDSIFSGKYYDLQGITLDENNQYTGRLIFKIGSIGPFESEVEISNGTIIIFDFPNEDKKYFEPFEIEIEKKNKGKSAISIFKKQEKKKFTETWLYKKTSNYNSFKRVKLFPTKKGHSYDVVVSGLQKYIRRGSLSHKEEIQLHIKKAFYCAFEVLTLTISAFTNLINRLKVILTEDIGIGEEMMIIHPRIKKTIERLDEIRNIEKIMFEEIRYNTYKKFKDSNKDKYSMNNSIVYKDNKSDKMNPFQHKLMTKFHKKAQDIIKWRVKTAFPNVAFLVYSLCVARKNRLTDNLNCLYFKFPEKRKEFETFDRKFKIKNLNDYIYTKKDKRITKNFGKKDEKKIKKRFKKFCRSIEAIKMWGTYKQEFERRVFYHAGYLDVNGWSYVIFNYVKQFYQTNERDMKLFEEIFKRYKEFKTKGSRRLFIAHILLFITRRIIFDKKVYTYQPINEIPNEYHYFLNSMKEAVILDMYDRKDKTIERSGMNVFNDWVYDKHTKIGQFNLKRKGRGGIKHFFDEATVLTNTNFRYINPYGLEARNVMIKNV